MGEMKNLLDEANASLGRFSKAWPDQMKGFGSFMQAVESPGALDSKQKELIAVALSTSAHCHWCIAYHVNGALEKGATEKEVMEAAWVAALMGGGPAVMYMQLVEKAINEFKKTKK